MGEEQQRRVFFSWQSDTPPKANRSVIEGALERATKQLSATWAPSDRPKVQTASSDVVGARPIADVIFERIRVADVFVADVSLVVRRGKRLMPNPNVLVETGYALHALSEARVILVLNRALGAPEDLPFDLRGRVALTYTMRPTDAPSEGRSHLERQFKAILTPMLSLPPSTADVRIDVSFNEQVSLEDPTQREPLFTAHVRNFSNFPVRLTHFGYETEDGKGLILPVHAPAITRGPIPPRDSFTMNAPESVIIRRKVVRVVATDSLGRHWFSLPGAIQEALDRRDRRGDHPA